MYDIDVVYLRHCGWVKTKSKLSNYEFQTSFLSYVAPFCFLQNTCVISRTVKRNTLTYYIVVFDSKRSLKNVY